MRIPNITSSIQTKLLWGIISVAIVVSVGSFILIALNQTDRMNNELSDNVDFLAKIVGEYAVSTLLFEDKEGAEDVLEKLRTIPYINEAHLYDTLGGIFASYSIPGGKTLWDFDLKRKIQDTSFTSPKATVTIRKIIYNNQDYGYIQLVADRSYIRAKINSTLVYLIMLFVLIVFLSYFLAKWIRKPLTTPLVELSAVISDITLKDEYKVDVRHDSDDEIGDLYRGFDIMIKKIESQRVKQIAAEQSLSRLNEDLEETVNRRTILLEAAIEQLKIEIEERERTAQELIATQHELSAALKLEKELSEIKNRFINMISHEYRTPLTIIMSSLSLLEKNSIPTDSLKFESHKEKIQFAIKRMLDMLNDVLTLGKIQDSRFALKIEKVNIMDIVNDVLSEVASINDSNHKLVLNHKETQYILNTDSTAFSHIFRNLITNAYKYSPEFSEIIVDVDFKDNFLLFTVEDRGIGISPEIKEKLFQPFNRGENAVNIQGTGLGLSIVKKYVDELGGTIDCMSYPEIGTKFIVKLPNYSH